MKKTFLVAGILMITTATFANIHIHIGNKARKEARIEKREARKDLRKERRMDNQQLVSSLTKNKFATDFPDAKNIHYARIDNFDVVTFISDKDKLKAYYDNNVQLVGTTQKESFTDLPAKAQANIQKEYPGYSVTAVIKYDDNAANDMDMILYGTTFDDDDNYFAEIQKDEKKIVLKIDLSGNVSYFKEIK